MNALVEILTNLDVTPIPNEIEEIPFAHALWPWVEKAKKRLKNHQGHLSEKAILCLEINLLKRWSSICAPTMTLEMATQKMMGQLQGDTPHERYLFFIDKFLKNDNLCAFFTEYTELKRYVSTFLDQWIEHTGEFIERLIKDLPDLKKTFNDDQELGCVTEISCPLSDPHNGGQAVLALTFACGKKILYKPKDLGATKAFGDLLSELNQKGLKTPLQGYIILPKGTYGWEEAVEHQNCATIEEVKNYYERAGSLLCLIYLLDGTDCHYENLIAHNQFPTLIDLETLFHGILDDTHTTNSVLKTGLLPSYIMGAHGKKGIDISALGSRGYEIERPDWEMKNTDEMRLISSRDQSCLEKHLPFYEGSAIKAEEYVEHIVLGFKNMYSTIQENPPSLLPFSNCTLRFVFRPTRLYSHLLRRLKDPTTLLHEEQRKEELSILEKYQDKEKLKPLIEEEKRALTQGDVPFFTAIPSEKHLYANGKIVLHNAFEKAPFENVLQKIEKMSDEDCALQEQFIRQSFYIKSHFPHLVETDAISPLPENILPPTSHEIKEAALKIGKWLKNMAYRTKSGMGWIGLEPDPLAEQFHLRPISDNLYGGKAGVALFFAALAKVTGKEEWEELALDAIGEMRKQPGEKMAAAMGVGGFTGIGGVAWSLLTIGKLLERKELCLEAKELLLRVEAKHIEQEKMLDVIGGSAGLILSILAHQETSLLPLAEKAADHLCKHAEKMPVGVAWGRFDHKRPLLGFSHGVAGIALALFKLGTLTKNDDYIKVAHLSLDYERSLYNPDEKNWPNLCEEIPQYHSRWCHGATGIGMARLAMCGNDARMHEEIAIALETTKQHMHVGRVPNLCCTSLGRLEFLEAAGRLLNQKEAADEAFPTIFARCQMKKEFPSPGLMQGESGIGYTLLRRLDPTLSQVLLLE